MAERTLLLVGCGKMGAALLSRWKQSRPAHISSFWVIDPSGKPVAGMKANWIADLKFLPAKVNPSIVVFAVKPQQLHGIMAAYRTRFKAKPIYLSIAAGKPMAFFQTHFGAGARIVRAMPNTPAMVGKGMTVLYPNASMTAPAKKIVHELMSAAGEVAWIEDESLMDIVTALSGSGPAYMFLILDYLVKAAVAAGLSPETARALAVNTMAGSAELGRVSKESLEDLRVAVTSPGGTTEAALSVLLDGRLEAILTEAVQKAVERSKELSR